MAPKKYTDEHYQFIKDNVKGRTTYELMEMFNEHFGMDITRGQLRAYLKNHNLKSDIDRSKLAQFNPGMFTAEQVKFIEDHVKGISNKDLAELLNKEFGLEITARQMSTYKKNHKLSSGLDGRFNKGRKPWNTGLKGVVTGGVQTQFKKGQRPKNWVPIGSERVNGDGYVDVKIADGKKQKNWKGKHILIWEKENGPVPKGHVVIFGDGNNRNFDINNLVLVSRRQLVRLNQKGLIQNDADLTRTAIIVTDIIHKISERKKKG